MASMSPLTIYTGEGNSGKSIFSSSNRNEKNIEINHKKFSVNDLIAKLINKRNDITEKLLHNNLKESQISTLIHKSNAISDTINSYYGFTNTKKSVPEKGKIADLKNKL